LKQRLLGAAVLIALAVIFVPMFLGNSPPRDTSTIQNLDIPPEPERNFETRTLPVEPAAPVAGKAPTPSAGDDKVVTVDTRAPATFEASDKPADDKSADKEPGDKIAAAKPSASTAAEKPKNPPPEAKSTALPAEPATPAPAGRFSVNLGVYADAGHADALVAKLRKAGYSASAEDTEYQGKPAHRVRVASFPDRAAAEAVRLKIKQLEPKVPSSVTESAEQPSADAPASALAANRAGGWAVQLGAFKSEAEANKLRDRIKGVSIAAFVDRTGSGNDALWRVRAGPFAERSGAEAARSTLKQRLQADGIVVTQP
jgi:DedD protein